MYRLGGAHLNKRIEATLEIAGLQDRACIPHPWDSTIPI
jgi:hypothetical protein